MIKLYGVFQVKCMNRWKWSVAIALLFVQQSQAQTAIEVFTDLPVFIQSLPDSGVEIVHYDLSEMDRLKRTALPKLPPRQEEAMRIATTFFQSAEGEAFKREMQIAGRAHQKFFQYQLKKLPAVVFDQGAYVVYGTTDIATARQAYVQRFARGASQ